MGTSEVSQHLLVNLVSFMSLIYVDYDCSNITPNDFERCSDKLAVVNTINHNLTTVVERVHTGFLREFWHAVEDMIDVGCCEVYAFQPTSGAFGPTDSSMMSFHYFFSDPEMRRMLFVSSVMKSRGRVMSGLESESDVSLSDRPSSTNSSKSSSLNDGEMNMSCSEGSLHDDMFL